MIICKQNEIWTYIRCSKLANINEWNCIIKPVYTNINIWNDTKQTQNTLISKVRITFSKFIFLSIRLFWGEQNVGEMEKNRQKTQKSQGKLWEIQTFYIYFCALVCILFVHSLFHYANGKACTPDTSRITMKRWTCFTIVIYDSSTCSKMNF